MHPDDLFPAPVQQRLRPPIRLQDKAALHIRQEGRVGEVVEEVAVLRLRFTHTLLRPRAPRFESQIVEGERHVRGDLAEQRWLLRHSHRGIAGDGQHPVAPAVVFQPYAHGGPSGVGLDQRTALAGGVRVLDCHHVRLDQRPLCAFGQLPPLVQLPQQLQVLSGGPLRRGREGLAITLERNPDVIVASVLDQDVAHAGQQCRFVFLSGDELVEPSHGTQRSVQAGNLLRRALRGGDVADDGLDDLLARLRVAGQIRIIAQPPLLAVERPERVFERLHLPRLPNHLPKQAFRAYIDQQV